VQYYVGEGDDRHLVDHPPLFACEYEGRKSLLTLNANFIQEMLSASQDIMPGNPGEIASGYFKPAEVTFTLPSFLIPPKVFLYNPNQLRGPEALPYLVILIDKKFFGIPARYLTPDRFAGCEGLKHMKVKRRARPASGGGAARRRTPPPGRQQGGRPRARLDESGVRGPRPRLDESGERGPRPRSDGSGSRRAQRPDESGIRRSGQSGRRPPSDQQQGQGEKRRPRR
jgi:hypothetical protein